LNDYAANCISIQAGRDSDIPVCRTMLMISAPHDWLQRVLQRALKISASRVSLTL
jgi:hypothetical protein